MSQYSDVSEEQKRIHDSEVLMNRVFGAFLSAVEYRKENDGLNRKALADALGKDETNVSKLLSGPRNWGLKTISDLARALKLNFQFALVDRKDSNILFLDTGRSQRFNFDFVPLTGAGITYESSNSIEIGNSSEVGFLVSTNHPPIIGLKNNFMDIVSAEWLKK